MKSIRLYPFFIMVIFTFSGCATMISSSKQEIPIESAPSGAEVTVTTSGGKTIFTEETPTAVKLSRKGEFNVMVKLDGYKSETIVVAPKRRNNLVYLNAVNLFFGSIVDAITGAAYKLLPEEISITLETARNDAGSQQEVYAVLKVYTNQTHKKTYLVRLQKSV